MAGNLSVEQLYTCLDIHPNAQIRAKAVEDPAGQAPFGGRARCAAAIRLVVVSSLPPRRASSDASGDNCARMTNHQRRRFATLSFVLSACDRGKHHRTYGLA